MTSQQWWKVIIACYTIGLALFAIRLLVTDTMDWSRFLAFGLPLYIFPIVGLLWGDRR